MGWMNVLNGMDGWTDGMGRDGIEWMDGWEVGWMDVSCTGLRQYDCNIRDVQYMAKHAPVLLYYCFIIIIIVINRKLRQSPHVLPPRDSRTACC